MKKVLILIILFFYPWDVFAERFIQLPFLENFNQNNYSDLVWLAEGNGATFTHLDSNCWSGGCAKFTPPNTGTNGTYSGLGQLSGLSGTQVNIRLLIYLGPTYVSTQTETVGGLGNKFIIVQGSTPPEPNRLGIMGLNGVLAGYESLGISEEDTGAYHYNNIGGIWPNDNPLFTVSLSERTGEWICIEYEINTTTDISKAYVWTTGGDFDGELLSTSNPRMGEVSYIDIIGGYYNRIHTNQDSGTYMLIDELAVDDSFIGPPAGFVGDDNTPPDTPEGLSVR